MTHNNFVGIVTEYPARSLDRVQRGAPIMGLLAYTGTGGRT